MRLGAGMAVMVGLLLAAGPVRAATLLYWDADGDSSTATGGSGTWDTTSFTWRVGSSTGTLTNWFDGAAPRFGGTAGTVTLAENVAVNGEHCWGTATGVRFLTSGYTIGAGGGTLTIQDQHDRPLAAATAIQSGYIPVTINAPLHLARNGTVSLEGSTVTLNGSISVGGTSTTVAGWSGTLVLGGSNGFSGTYGNGSFGYVLQINHNNALNGKNLYWVALNSVSAGPTNPTLTSAATFDNNQMAVFSGSNSLTLGNSIYQISTTGLGAGINVQNAPATLTFASLQERSDGGVAGWNGNFTKNGAGTLKINGRYSCGGKTTVSAGTMLINGPTGDRTGTSTYVGTPDWVVNSGATLGGTGTIWLATGKTNTVNAGGALAPGGAVSNSVGTLTVTGAVTLASSAVYKWEYADGSGDLVALKGANGTLTLPSVATVQVSRVSGEFPNPSPLFTATTLAGATDLSQWVVTGLPKGEVEIQGTSVILFIPPPRGTVILLR